MKYKAMGKVKTVQFEKHCYCDKCYQTDWFERNKLFELRVKYKDTDKYDLVPILENRYSREGFHCPTYAIISEKDIIFEIEELGEDIWMLENNQPKLL